MQVEETVVESAAEEVAPQPQMSQAEQAAMRFTNLLPFVKKIAAAAEGKKSLVRVMHALAEFPLGSTQPRLLNDNERQLFQIMQELNQFKTVILQEIIKQRQIPSAGEGTSNESEKE